MNMMQHADKNKLLGLKPVNSWEDKIKKIIFSNQNGPSVQGKQKGKTRLRCTISTIVRLSLTPQ